MSNIDISQELSHNSFNLPVFATQEFLKIKSTKNNFGYFHNDVCAIPFFVENYFHIKRLRFTETVLKRIDTAVSAEAQKSFLDDVISLVQKKKFVDFIAPPMPHCVFNVVPENVDYIRWGSFIMNLENASDKEEDIFKLFPHRFRNRIYKGLDEHTEVSETDDVKIVHDIISDTFKRQKSPYTPPYSFLEQLKTRLKNNTKLFTASNDGEIQGVAVILYNENGAYNYYAGSVKRPTNGSLNVLQYSIIKLLIEMHVPKYDFMGARLMYRKGSKFEGIQQYKKSLGTELDKGYIFSYVANKINYKLFNTLVKIYTRFTGKEYEGDVIRQTKTLEEEYAKTQSEDIVVL